MMGFDKETIRERLRTVSKWVTGTHTEMAETAAVVPEFKMRYVVMIYINGDQQAKRDVEISVLKEGGTAGTVADHNVKFSNINVAPADNVQIPEGGYDIENPIFTMEGGTRGPYARTLKTGTSVNMTVTYWENDI